MVCSPASSGTDLLKYFCMTSVSEEGETFTDDAGIAAGVSVCGNTGSITVGIEAAVVVVVGVDI